MTPPKAPCYKCTDREVGCHSTCEKFIVWDKEHRANREKELDKKLKRFDVEGYVTEAIKANRKGNVIGQL